MSRKVKDNEEFFLPGDFFLNSLNKLQEEKPVDFKTFVRDKNYLHEPLEVPQIEEASQLFVNGKDIWSWERQKNLFVWLWGKGSGKGTLAVDIQLYAFYRLLLMEKPQEFFRILPSDTISFVNLALSGEQTKTNIFERLVSRLKDINWFKEHYEIWYKGKRVSDKNVMRINITEKRVETDKNVVIFSENTEYEHWEGKNIVFFVIDEYSGAKTEAEKVWASEVLKSVMTSSREMPYIGIVMSYMRLDPEIDNTHLLVEDIRSKRIKNGYASVRFAWEMRPSYYQGPFRVYHDKLSNKNFFVPKQIYRSLYPKYEDDLRRKHLNLPGRINVEKGPFFPPDVDFMSSIDKGRPDSIVWEPILVPRREEGYLRRVNIKAIHLFKDYKYVLALDKGEKHSDAALSVGHLSMQFGDTLSIVIDSIIVWEPESKSKIAVDVENITDVIIQIITFLGKENVLSIRMDHWNSSDIIAVLKRIGFMGAHRDAASLDGYQAMRDFFMKNAFRLPDTPFSKKGIMQLRYLKTRSAGKPRVSLGKQDIIDTWAEISEDLLNLKQIKKVGIGRGFVRSGNNVPFISSMQGSQTPMADYFFGKNSPIRKMGLGKIIRLPIDKGFGKKF